MKLIDDINKKYGDNSLFLYGDMKASEVPVIPTGSLLLDIALGIGGIPRGRITEIYGPESSGKTTLCKSIAGNCQKLGGKVAFIDVEHALDPYWAEVCGVNVNELLLSQPDYAEMALNIVEMIVRAGDVDLIILDSVASLAPKAEVEGEMGDAHMALVARLMSQAMRKLTAIVSDSNTAVIFTNQLRKKIGVVFGSPDTTTGGEALKYYSSIRLDLRPAEAIKDKTDVIGKFTKCTVRKNKMAPPFKQIKFNIYFDKGMSQPREIMDWAIGQNIINKSGSWFIISDNEGTLRIQGENNLLKKLKEDEEFLIEIENKFRLQNGLPLRSI